MRACVRVYLERCGLHYVYRLYSTGYMVCVVSIVYCDLHYVCAWVLLHCGVHYVRVVLCGDVWDQTHIFSCVLLFCMPCVLCVFRATRREGWA